MSFLVSSTPEIPVGQPLTTTFSVFSSGLGNVKISVWVFLTSICCCSLLTAESVVSQEA